MGISKNKLEEQKQERLGQEKLNNQGYLMKCVEYKSAGEIVVEFLDNYHAKVNSRWDIFTSGLIKNPNQGKERIGTIVNNISGYPMKCIEYNGAMNIRVKFLDDFGAEVDTEWNKFINGKVKNPNNYKERIGEINYNNKNEKMKVIEYNDSQNIVVEFQDEWKRTKNTSWNCFKNGQVKNPHDDEIEIDLSGETFENWHVISKTDDYISPSGSHYKAWLCWCDCEKDLPFEKRNKYKITESRLLNNRSTCCVNCGIKKRAEKIKLSNRKNRSQYDLDGEFGIGYTYDGNVFYFDLEDYNKIKDYNWYVNDQHYLLARVNIGNGKIKNVRMHRIIMEVNNSEIEIDHIHGINSRNDNRKSNLRIATHSQNNINKDKTKNNTSGIKGVSWDKRVEKWRVRISVDNVCYELGFFDNKEDAEKIRQEAEEKYFGEWSYKNSINKGA